MSVKRELWNRLVTSANNVLPYRSLVIPDGLYREFFEVLGPLQAQKAADSWKRIVGARREEYTLRDKYLPNVARYARCGYATVTFVTHGWRDPSSEPNLILAGMSIRKPGEPNNRRLAIAVALTRLYSARKRFVDYDSDNVVVVTPSPDITEMFGPRPERLAIAEYSVEAVFNRITDLKPVFVHSSSDVTDMNEVKKLIKYRLVDLVEQWSAS